jgi:ubiquinol-cytochrome c reductase cytochrome b subunit
MGLSGLRYPVPEHANRLSWSLGGITAVSLVVLIVTGVLLAQYYVPDPALANQSVRYIMTEVPGGEFLRGVHFWGAQAMYITAALHLLRVFLTASYKKPREGNWLVGVGMFGLTFLALFTGTVLKWDQEGFEALGHNLESAALLGGAGYWFSAGFASTVPILTRLYTAHVVIVPGLILLLLFVHVLLIKRHRISPHPLLPATEDGQAPAQEPTDSFTRHLRRVGAFGLVLVGVLGLLATLFPVGVGSPPAAGVEFTQPLWPFWWMYTLEDWVGLPGILWGSGVFYLLLILLPFIDRNPARHPRQRKVALTVGAVVVTAVVVLSVLMPLLPSTAHLGM